VSDPLNLHATTIALWRGGAWRGVLLRGRSGAGKSGLALNACEAGWRLVADDRTVAWASGGRLYCQAAAPLRGLVEARGIGIAPAPTLPRVQAFLVGDLADGPDDVERMPEPAWVTLAGVRLPLVRLWAHDAAATSKLALAVSLTGVCGPDALGCAG
jgi:serine kinase of HPr protein (carbohydrate metabolism regulator)